MFVSLLVRWVSWFKIWANLSCSRKEHTEAMLKHRFSLKTDARRGDESINN